MSQNTPPPRPPPPSEDPRSTEELFQAALHGDREDEAAWEAVTALHFRPTREVLERAQRLCGSPAPHERSRGVDILAQLGGARRIFTEERRTAILDLLATELSAGYSSILLQAASELAHPSLLPALRALKDTWNGPDWLLEELHQALARCGPGAAT